MIKFLDSIDNERAIEWSKSFDGKYVNLTTFGTTIQIPREQAKEVLAELEELINNLA